MIMLAAYMVFTACLFILAYRNHWVFTQRQRLNSNWYDARVREIHELSEDEWDRTWYDEYYLTYDQMMLKFWVWDIEKLRK